MTVRHKVVVKVMKSRRDTKEVIARFEVERRALPVMAHPGIAKVLDAGATDAVAGAVGADSTGGCAGCGSRTGVTLARCVGETP